MQVKLPFLTLAATLLFVATVRADPVEFRITPNQAFGFPGQTITFSMEFTNLGSSPVIPDFGSLRRPTSGPGIVDVIFPPDPFFGLVILKDETATVRFFTVTIFQTAKEGEQISFTYDLGYVVTDSGEIKVVTATSTVNVVPEPATLLLLGTGIAGVAIKTRKRLKARKREQGSQ